MTSLHPATLGALVIGGLLLFVLLAAATSDQRLAMNDRRDQVVANFAGLRLTSDDVIVGAGKNSRRIPLAGLAVEVTHTESADGASVLVTITGAGRPIQRREPLSYGASGEAAIFEVRFNAMTRSVKPAAEALALAA